MSDVTLELVQAKQAELTAMIEQLAKPATIMWAENIASRGTDPVQPAPSAKGETTDYLGWLMGLEPTTTRITSRSREAAPGSGKAPQRRKAA